MSDRALSSPHAPASAGPAAWPMATVPIGQFGPLFAPVAVGTVLRLVHLAARPLGPDEATVALAGWQAWRDGTLPDQTSPALPVLLSLLFGAFGAGDGLARLPGALAGAALVATPLHLSRHLGRPAALAAAWLLALSPLLVLSSRTIGGMPLVLLALAGIVVCWLGWTEARQARWLVGLGAAIAVGLGASPRFVPGLAVVVLAALLVWGWPARPWWRELARQWRWLAAGAGLVVVGLDTRLLTLPFGLQTGVVDPLWRWPDGLTLALDTRLLVVLATVEFSLAVAALAGLIRALHPKAAPLNAFLALWFLLALPLALGRSPNPLEGLVWPLLPAALLGGSAVARAWAVLSASPPWRGGLVALAAAVPLVHLALQAHASARQEQALPLAHVLTALVGLLAVALTSSGSLRRDAVWQALLLAVGCTGLILSVAFIGRLSLRSDAPPPLAGAWADPSLREVAAQALAWSRQHHGERLTLDAEAARWLAWPLRSVPLEVVQAGQPARWRGVAADAPARDPAGPAALKIPAGAVIEWRATAGPGAWWRWLVTGRDWVAIQPYAIMRPRS